MKTKIKAFAMILCGIMLIGLVSACTAKQSTNTTENKQLRKITVLLDWVPNTNHTGLIVAQEKGFFKEYGLDANIIQPSEGGAATLVGAKQADFAVSYQEEVTYARTAAKNVPIVAIAAVIQHNTSGFASPASKNIKTPKDFEGKTYGGWGSPMEEAVLKGLMEKYGADFSKLKIVDIGDSDFFGATKNNVDFTWIFEGWDGAAAKVKNIPINMINLKDEDVNLDYYTPVLIANEDTVKNDPQLCKDFLAAVTKGYEYCIQNPEDAANILCEFAPETDKAIALEGQKYLANEYQSDAPRWGEMKTSVWENYSNWMFDKGLTESKLDVSAAFTNDFLPTK